jgi:hypothetical protein
MSHHDDHLHDAELGPVIDRLQAERPMASALELDLIKQRVRGRVARGARRSRRTEFMRSRFAIVLALVLGFVLSTGGGALALQGFSSSDSAAVSQYGNENGGNGGQQGVLGEEQGGGGKPAAKPAPAVQPARQVEAGVQSGGSNESQLPFTGFAAIPILIGGVALLTVGLVLRRRSGDQRS